MDPWAEAEGFTFVAKATTRLSVAEGDVAGVTSRDSSAETRLLAAKLAGSHEQLIAAGGRYAGSWLQQRRADARAGSQATGS